MDSKKIKQQLKDLVEFVLASDLGLDFPLEEMVKSICEKYCERLKKRAEVPLGTKKVYQTAKGNEVWEKVTNTGTARDWKRLKTAKKKKPVQAGTASPVPVKSE